MIVVSHNTQDPKIKIVEFLGWRLTGSFALRFQKHSFACLEKGKCYQLINLKYLRNIDSIGIDVLVRLISRGVHIRLFNVKPEIRETISMTGKEEILKIYNEEDSQRAVSMFESEMLEETKDKDGVAKRNCPRIDTFFKADFKYCPSHNGVISGRATILDLSESGLFADQVLAMDAETEEIVIPKEIVGYELYDMRFSLNGIPNVIEAKGECVREYRNYEKLCAGIRFKSMRQDHKELVKYYVHKTIQDE